jgi:hypothetical protein
MGIAMANQAMGRLAIETIELALAVDHRIRRVDARGGRSRGALNSSRPGQALGPKS